jgi:hypothetical protein
MHYLIWNYKQQYVFFIKGGYNLLRGKLKLNCPNKVWTLLFMVFNMG